MPDRTTASDPGPVVGTLALIVGLSAGVLAVAGSFLPYNTATWVVDGEIQSVTGTGWWADVNGQSAVAILDGIPLGVGALMLAAGVLWGAARPRARRPATLLVGVGAGVVSGTVAYLWLTIEAMFRAADLALAAGTLDTSTFSIEIGSWTLLAAGVAALLAATLVLVPGRPVDN
ncbi:hypothetical protein [Pseudonocardia sp. WMMC193]|uniref:hypothetical protein n=1 Tax=Pseudonocardia sp. WMMC193 TaxID=2911965 RepID=UPI001F161FC8|nr:hypothetical protein [Pseudonocardia sp. WMMC193]MCF7551067.1 hypothetical protein [Pseudonocardia sp. WMMC193]